MIDAVEHSGLIKCDEYCRPMISETSENNIGQLEQSRFRQMLPQVAYAE